jgi:hypothetical protein
MAVNGWKYSKDNKVYVQLSNQILNCFAMLNRKLYKKSTYKHLSNWWASNLYEYFVFYERVYIYTYANWSVLTQERILYNPTILDLTLNIINDVPDNKLYISLS